LVAAQLAAPRQLGGEIPQRAGIQSKQSPHLLAQRNFVVVGREQIGNLLVVGTGAHGFAKDDALSLAPTHQNQQSIATRRQCSVGQVIARGVTELHALQGQTERDGHEGMPGLVYRNHVIHQSHQRE
jgi:hypothetical protein